MPEARAASGDLSLGDSLIVNPHKTLYTPVEVSCLLLQAPGRAARHLQPGARIPAHAAGDPLVDQLHGLLAATGAQLSARSSSGGCIRTFGVAGMRARMAERDGAWRAAWKRAPTPTRTSSALSTSPFALVCLRAFPRDLRAAYAGADARPAAGHPGLSGPPERRRSWSAINTAGHAFLSHTVLREGYTLRVSIGNIRTEARHIDALWRELQSASSTLDAALRPDGRLPT